MVLTTASLTTPCMNAPIHTLIEFMSTPVYPHVYWFSSWLLDGVAIGSADDPGVWVCPHLYSLTLYATLRWLFVMLTWLVVIFRCCIELVVSRWHASRYHSRPQCISVPTRVLIECVRECTNACLCCVLQQFALNIATVRRPRKIQGQFPQKDFTRYASFVKETWHFGNSTAIAYPKKGGGGGGDLFCKSLGC